MNISNLPYNEDGSSNDDFVSQPVEAPEINFFGVLGETQNPNDPIFILYKNNHTLSEGSMEIPLSPLSTAIKNDRSVVVYFVNDIGKVYATRWDNEEEIRHHVIGRRFLPHFPTAKPYMRALNPDGFYMAVCRVDFREFVELSEFPDEKTKIKLTRKTKHLTNN